MSEGRIVLDYQEMIAAVRTRIDEVRAPYTAIEEAARIPGGYLGKTIGPAQVKVIGIGALLKVLETIGLRLAIVPHLTIEATIDEMGHVYRLRSEGRRSVTNIVRKRISPEVKRLAAREFGAMGRGVPKAFGITSKELTKKQRKASRARWDKVRATKQHIGITGVPWSRRSASASRVRPRA
jgi:hypothetical protein